MAGVFQDNQFLGSYVTSNALIGANTNSVRDAVVLVKTASTTTAVQDGLKKAIAGFPELKVRTGAQFKADQKKAIKNFLYFIYEVFLHSERPFDMQNVGRRSSSIGKRGSCANEILLLHQDMF